MIALPSRRADEFCRRCPVLSEMPNVARGRTLSRVWGRVRSRVHLVQSELEPFRRELTRYCYRMLGSGFEAEDAVQETMLRAWRNADKFEGRSSVRSWLYRIATNVCIDMQRNVQRRARPMEMGPSSPPVESHLGPTLPEALWITPIADASVAPEGADPAEVVPVPGVDPAGVRRRAAAPARPASVRR